MLDLQVEHDVVEDVDGGLAEVLDPLDDLDEELQAEVVVLGANVVFQALLVLGVLLDEANERRYSQDYVCVVILRDYIGSALTAIDQGYLTKVIALANLSDENFSAFIVFDSYLTEAFLDEV